MIKYEKLKDKQIQLLAYTTLFIAILSIIVAVLFPTQFKLFEKIILVTILLIISFIDLKTLTIADSHNMFCIVTAAIFIVLKIIIYKESVIPHLFGFIVGFVIFLSLTVISNNGFGGGDIKLIATLGLWLGVRHIYMVIACSFLVAAVAAIIMILFKKKNMSSSLAFSPFITIATIFIIF